jgi:Skp family chaperone for outer membrane proteins
MADSVTIVDTPPPSPPPAPTRTVMASSIPNPVEPTEPKKGSAMERMRESLRAKAKADPNAEPSPVVPSPPAPKAGEPPTPPAPPTGAEPNVENPAGSAPTPPAPKKMTLGQALDNYKKRNKELETELSELKTKTANVDAKALSERASALEARNKELEEEIRYVNYQKSQEFTDKYKTPYDNAWKRAMDDLKEVVIPTENGEGRAVTGNDMLEIVNMPLAKARQVAREVFGEMAEEVLGHRREIKKLFDEQSEALKEARTNGEAREKARNEQVTKLSTEIKDYVKNNWDKANSDLQADAKWGTFFKPIEGDAEGNQRLAKGYELVKRAFEENPNDPRLSAEQRLAIIRRHSAVFNRAAGFGRLAWKNEQLTSENADLKKKLADLEGTTPPAGGGNGNPVVVSSSGSAWDRVRGDLSKYAH